MLDLKEIERNVSCSFTKHYRSLKKPFFIRLLKIGE